MSKKYSEYLKAYSSVRIDPILEYNLNCLSDEDAVDLAMEILYVYCILNRSINNEKNLYSEDDHTFKKALMYCLSDAVHNLPGDTKNPFDLKIELRFFFHFLQVFEKLINEKVVRSSYIYNQLFGLKHRYKNLYVTKEETN